MLWPSSVSKQVFVQNLSYENEFDLHENQRAGETYFHMNGFAQRLVLILRQKTTRKGSIHFHPCNPVFLPKNTLSIMFCGIFLSNLFVYLVAWQYNAKITK